jgi:hypothetical protein
MKLSESKIKQIIIEEIEAIYLEQQEEKEEPEVKMQPDVKMIMKMIPKVDNYVEYEQLLSSLLNHDFGDESRKKAILIRAQRNILKMLQEK